MNRPAVPLALLALLALPRGAGAAPDEPAGAPASGAGSALAPRGAASSMSAASAKEMVERPTLSLCYVVA